MRLPISVVEYSGGSVVMLGVLSDGNGNWIMTKKTGMTLGVALVLLGLVVTVVAQGVALQSDVDHHIGNTQIHVSQADRDGSVEGNVLLLQIQQDVEELKVICREIEKKR